MYLRREVNLGVNRPLMPLQDRDLSHAEVGYVVFIIRLSTTMIPRVDDATVHSMIARREYEPHENQMFIVSLAQR